LLMKLPSLLALLSLLLLVDGAADPKATTASIHAPLPGAGEDPSKIQENIDRIQGEIQNLNVKVSSLLSALNETNALPFQKIDQLTADILAQQDILNKVNGTIWGLKDQINTKDAEIKNITGFVNCFKSSECGPEQF
ncbi:hypothetical protein PENTCL1PPCAC_17527, partial [Pristionchus entomophagus]